MDAAALLGEWAAAASTLSSDPTLDATFGRRDVAFAWASVSKLAVAALVGVAVQEGTLAFDEPLGPTGSTVAHVLAHASGLGPSRDALGAKVGTKRIYSTYGFELIAERLGGTSAVVENIRRLLGLRSVISDGTAGGGLIGTLTDLETLARIWMGQGPISSEILREMTRVFLPDIGGVVPGFGSFQPSPWGLGPQIKGSNTHWIGEKWPSAAFGHFGQSGSLVLIDPEQQFAVVALSSRDFGPWAVSTWPSWTSRMYELAQ